MTRSSSSRCGFTAFLAATATLLSAPGLTGLDPAQAQGVVGSPLTPTATSSSPPSGPGLSRLPLIGEQAFQVGGTPGATLRQAPGVAGASRDWPGPGTKTTPSDDPAPRAFGTFQWPFTMARVANTNMGPAPFTAIRHPVTGYPFRAAGKLWMRFGSSWFVCTAALIKKGLLLTAAHCVFNYRRRAAGWTNEIRFYPANISNSMTTAQPYGVFTRKRIFIPTPYWAGTDTCQAGAVGIVCNNDLALIVLNQRGGRHAGQIVGWYGYGWNGYSYVMSNQFGNQRVADITQLGYPAAWDRGYQMERGNSFGKRVLGTGTNGRQLINTQLGSAQTGGSSGGPWLVNFGTTPARTSSGASAGSHARRRVVVGVTSWGYTTTGPKVQGASWFGRNNEFPLANYDGRGGGNIGALVNAACSAYPAYC